MHSEARQLTDPAPRRVDVFSKFVILFGGFSQQFGWIFFTVGSLFAWIFIPISEVRYWFVSEKNWVETGGDIMAIEQTNASVNDAPVYKIVYGFDVEGKIRTGNGYAYGQTYQVGQEVQIKYRPDAPDKSYIMGARRSMFPAFVLFILIFPAVGLAFLIPSFLQNLKAVRLLENGAFTRGKMAEKSGTNTTIKINNTTYPVYKYSFEFTTAGRTYTAACRTHQTWKVEDEEQEIILYDRFNPGFNVVYDAAPNMPGISAAGELKPAPAWKAVNLILPALGIGLNAYFIWMGTPWLGS